MKCRTGKKAKKEKKYGIPCFANGKLEDKLIERYFGRTSAFDTFNHNSITFSRIKSNIYRNESTGGVHRMTLLWHWHWLMRVNCDDRMMPFCIQFVSDIVRSNSSTVLKAWKVFSSNITICYDSSRYYGSKRQCYLRYSKYMLDEPLLDDPFIDTRHLCFDYEHDCSVLSWFDRADRMIFWKHLESNSILYNLTSSFTNYIFLVISIQMFL
jgi:hypothetical protein